MSTTETLKLRINDISKINSFIKEFETMDNILFLEILPDKKMLSKYVDSLDSIFRYNNIDISEDVEVVEGTLDRRIGIALYNLKKVIAIFSLLEKDEKIDMTLELIKPKIKKLTNAWEVKKMTISSEQFKKIEISMVTSVMIKYLTDDVIQSLTEPKLKTDDEQGYLVKFDLDIELVKKIKSIVKLDESLSTVEILAKAGGNKVRLNFDDKFTIDHELGVTVKGNLKVLFSTTFIKKINDENYKIFIDEDKMLLVSDVTNVLYAFTAQEDADND